MSDHATPTPLGSYAAYYREQAGQCQQTIDCAAHGTPAAYLEAIARQRDLWIQLANELDAYLVADDGPGLF